MSTKSVPAHEACFPEQQAKTPLPETLTKASIAAEIDAEVEKILTEVIDAEFPRPRLQSKNQAQINLVRTMQKELKVVLELDHGTDKVEDFEALRRIAKKALETIREATKNNSRFPDRSMAESVKGRIQEVKNRMFGTLRTAVGEGIARAKESGGAKNGGVEKNAKVHGHMEALLRSFKPLELGKLLTIEGKPVVSGDEKVTLEGGDLFVEFVILVEGAVDKLRTNADLRLATITAIRDHYKKEDPKSAVFERWASDLLPKMVPTLDDGDNDPNHWKHVLPTPHNGPQTRAETLLMPKKMRTFEERTTENGEPLWEMTQEESLLLKSLWQTAKREKGDDWQGDADAAFLQTLSDEVNRRCNGHYKLLRPTIEVRSRVMSLEARAEVSGNKASDAPAAAPEQETMRPTLENPPFAEIVNHVLRSDVADIVQQKISKGDQIARQLMLELHAHVASRREAAWNSPQSTTAFDEFAVRYLQILTNRKQGQLIKMGATGSSVTFEQNFKRHLEGGEQILNELRMRLPAEPESQVTFATGAEANGYYKRVRDLVAITKPLTATVEKKGIHAVESNKYISQAMILKMHADLDAAAPMLDKQNMLPKGMSLPYFRSLLAIAETVMSIYTIDKKDELGSRIPQLDQEEPTKELVRSLRTELETHGTRLMPVHAPRMEIAVGTTNAVDTDALAAELDHREESAKERLAALNDVVPEALTTLYAQAKSLELQLAGLAVQNVEDDDLGAWLDGMKARTTSLLTLFPHDKKPANPAKATVGIMKLAAEVARIDAETAAHIASAQQAVGERADLNRELADVAAKRTIVKEIAGIQSNLRRAIESLQAHTTK